MPAIKIVQSIQRGELSAVNHLDECLTKIQENKDLNIFLNTFPEKAKKKAADIDQRIKNSHSVGTLAGLVIAIKDNINIKDEITTCGSKILEPFKSPYNATVINKLEAEDAIIIGKTNLDEFAMGSSNENSAFGPVKNPHNNEMVPGGSSGGSAVAVATGCADIALGSDTGGSVRQPASFTGTVGLKPSYGRISRYGLVAFASSLDQIGIFGNSSQDAAFVLATIAGHDKMDSTSADIEIPDYAGLINPLIKGLKIGVPKQYFAEGLDPEINTRIMEIVGQLKDRGADIVNIDLKTAEYAIAIYYIIATAEASSNLSRFDGVRYGARLDEGKGLIDMYEKTRNEGFGEEVQRRILLGTYVLSAGYYDAYYKKAQQVRRLLKNDFDEAFTKCDVILSPTTPTTAFKIGEKKDDPLSMYLQDIYTVSANLAGICGMSIPAGTHSNCLPFGVQLQAKAFNEQAIFDLGSSIEKIIKTD
ncbi:MAG: Asp-tRNA(Asn)/Glu-tRNA(Gln) amidotransferase subunit GatA [Calditrichaeota bacterium]|nr:MAG: Asp-tRNA(Asn)/Glu-tRNA(Gln) amidotransferase subunit GatA [Calditrichota bacterium]MBL1206927.1 Asp-tRNA(Asn)/Glu-tRNA(Gln) amidotransferase subunit GatA [Calditrichota bacterium]NOG46754.1 Asp-tRNA(Asn)/Glu-tRNA(Gln) amidotransferase subunit GatA [Calditrichota bacterium]